MSPQIVCLGECIITLVWQKTTRFLFIRFIHSCQFWHFLPWVRPGILFDRERSQELLSHERSYMKIVTILVQTWPKHQWSMIWHVNQLSRKILKILLWLEVLRRGSEMQALSLVTWKGEAEKIQRKGALWCHFSHLPLRYNNKMILNTNANTDTDTDTDTNTNTNTNTNTKQCEDDDCVLLIGVCLHSRLGGAFTYAFLLTHQMQHTQYYTNAIQAIQYKYYICKYKGYTNTHNTIQKEYVKYKTSTSVIQIS